MRIQKDRPITESSLEDPVNYARALGRKVYLKPGELAFTELEISYLLSCLRKLENRDEKDKRKQKKKTQTNLDLKESQQNRQGFDDNPHVRIRRHVLLYWEKSFYKSTMLTQFSWECCGGAELTTIPQESIFGDNMKTDTKKLILYLSRKIRGKKRKLKAKLVSINAIEAFFKKHNKLKPTHIKSDFYKYVHFINLTGDIKRPVLKGSINRIQIPGGGEKFKVVLPLMKFADIWIADELFDFIGKNTDSAEASFLLNVLEGGRGKVAMVSMVGVTIDRATRRILAKNEIIFDVTSGMMSYWCNGTFWGGTRPIFEKNLMKALWEGGFFDRYSVVPWIPEVGERKDMILKVQKSLAPFSARLYRINRVFWNTRFREIMTPPADLWNKTAEYGYDVINKKAMEQGVDYEANPRDALYCRQLLTVAALIRTVKTDYNKQWWSKANEPGVGPHDPIPEFYNNIKVHEKLEYIPADFDWAKQYIDMYAANKIAFVKTVFAVMKEKDVSPNKYAAVLTNYGQGSKIKCIDLIRHIMKFFNIKDKQAYNVLHNLETSGFVKTSGKGPSRMATILRQEDRIKNEEQGNTAK